ncbi:unnamed protein product, partial [Pylaiella littoralis]
GLSRGACVLPFFFVGYELVCAGWRSLENLARFSSCVLLCVPYYPLAICLELVACTVVFLLSEVCESCGGVQQCFVTIFFVWECCVVLLYMLRRCIPNRVNP